MKLYGEGGIKLQALWVDGPRAYYAVMIPHFPNLCLLNGPTGPVGNLSLVDIAEKQWGYFDQLIDLLRTGQCIGIAPTMAALEAYEAARDKDAMRTVFASGCKSWYLNDKGIPQVWPWSYDHFVEVMAAPRLGDFELLLPATTGSLTG